MSRAWAATAAAVALAAALPFAGTLGHGFALDDATEVVRNAHVQSLAEAPRLFAEGAWAGAGESNPIYRPLTSFTYALNHAVGGLDPAGYHLVNLLLHAACAAMLLLVARALGASLPGAAAAALLFAVHPLHVEVAANVAGRKDALAALFTLGTLLAHRAALRGGGWRLPLAWLTLAAALLSKESGGVALGLVGAWDLLVEPAAWRERPRRAAALYLGHVATVALYFVARRAAVGSLGVPLAFIPFVENPLPHLPAATRLLTAVAVLGRGLWLHLWPARLSPDYSFDAIPAVATPLEPAFLASAAVIVALAGGAWWARRRRPALAFLALWYAGAVFPTSNLLVPVGTIFGERLLYLASGAACLAAGILLQPWLTRARPWGAGLLVVIAAALAWRTVGYSAAWRDEVTLFREAVAAQPGSAKAHDLLGAALLEVGEVEAGTLELAEAVARLERAPEPPTGQRLKLGVALERGGRLEEAEAQYQRILREVPGYADATWRLGVVRWRQGRRAEAEALWERTLAADPGHARAMSDLGLALQARGDLAGAEALWRRAAAADPLAAGPWLSLGGLHLSRGETEPARQAFRRFLELARYGVYPGQRERVEALLRQLDQGAAPRPGGAGP